MPTVHPLPSRWDLTCFFPGPDSPEFQSARADLLASFESVRKDFDAWDASGTHDESLANTVAAAESLIARYSRLQDDAERLHMYLICLVSADATDAVAQSALSQLQQDMVGLMLLATRFANWTISLPLEDLSGQSDLIRDHAFALRSMQRSAAHQMSPVEEALAAELNPTGAPAWSRLRQDIEARLTFRIMLDNEDQTLPISESLNLALHPDRGVRQAASQAATDAWRSVEVPVSAALNGVKGETLILTARRGWDDPLDAALFRNHIDRATLDVLLEAVRGALPDYQRYLRAKATALGLSRLARYDVLAPVGSSDRSWPYEDAVKAITGYFARISPKLAKFATRAVTEGWIDVDPRPGKEGGGFCTGIGGDQSRILLNYAPIYLWLSGTAHELGHAYHNAVQHEFGRSWLQRSLMPPTLAEAASTFCETVVHQAVLADATDEERLGILGDVLIAYDLNVFGPITGYTFEQELFTARRQRALSSEELAALGLVAQQARFGDAVDLETISPFTWAELPHPFIADLWYYNFPYTFGMLFAIGLYTELRKVPEGFWDRFDALLAGAGTADAAELAARMGIDLRSRAFWEQGLDLIRANIDEFERLVGAGEGVVRD